MPVPNFDGVLLDYDGTVLDTEALYIEAYTMTLAREHVDFASVDYRKIVGRPAVQVFAELRDRFGFETEVAYLYRDFHEALYGPLIRKARMRQGADQLLDLLEQYEVPHAIVTNAPRPHVTKLSTMFPRFHRMPWVCRDDVRLGGLYKPDKRPFVLGAEVLGIDPRRCVVFGDTANDTVAGRAAGCFVIGLPHEHSPAADLKDAHLLLPDLRHFRFDMVPMLPLSP